MMRSPGRKAWVAWACFMAVSAAAVIVHLVYAPLEDARTNVSALAAFAVFATVGVLVMARRPGHPIGWIYAIGSIAAAVGSLCDALTRLGRDIPLAPLVWWGGAVLGVVPLLVLIPLPLLFFPSGNLPSRRWRPLLWTAVAAIAAVGSYPAFSSAWFTDGPANPVAIAGAKSLLQGLNSLGLFALVVVTVTAIVSLFRHFRRASGAEREQLKWLAWAGVWTIVLIFMAGPGTYGIFYRIEVLQPVLFFLSPFFFSLGLAVIPLSMAFAILRFRLWDIDRIVSRTVAYAIITSLLAGIYALAVLGPTSLVGRGDTPDWVIAGATLVVAALFQPVRRRVQRIVDRRFNRERYDAAGAVDTFTRRLRDEIDIDTLSVDLQTLVHHTMEPDHVSLWMRPRAGR